MYKPIEVDYARHMDLGYSSPCRLMHPGHGSTEQLPQSYNYILPGPMFRVLRHATKVLAKIHFYSSIDSKTSTKAQNVTDEDKLELEIKFIVRGER